MDKIKQIIMAIVQAALRFVIRRKKIALRFITTLIYTILWTIVNIVIFLLTIFQYIILLLTTIQIEAIKNLSHKLTAYSYKMLRYMTLNETATTFPFGKLPGAIEPAEKVDLSVPISGSVSGNQESQESTE